MFSISTRISSRQTTDWVRCRNNGGHTEDGVYDHFFSSILIGPRRVRPIAVEHRCRAVEDRARGVGDCHCAHGVELRGQPPPALPELRGFDLLRGRIYQRTFLRLGRVSFKSQSTAHRHVLQRRSRFASLRNSLNCWKQGLHVLR